MTIENSHNSDSLCTEAPASWNTRYISPEGFECQLTLRGETGQELLEKASGAIARLQKMGCKPYRYSKGTYQQQNSQSQKTDGSNGNGNDQSWCPIHNCSMKRWDKTAAYGSATMSMVSGAAVSPRRISPKAIF